MSGQRNPRWVGATVIWWGGDEWQFTNCVRCGKTLQSARAIKNGYGPECADTRGIASMVRATLTAEREQARAALARGATPAPHNRRTRRASNSRAPSPKQMSLLRDLARKAGRDFVMPRTARQASLAIDRLKQPA